MILKEYMTGAEWENFRAQDKKEYMIHSNSCLLEWLQEKEGTGYYPYITLDQLQELVDFITLWYEIRFPNDKYNPIEYIESGIVPSSNNQLAEVMNYEQLLLRLPPKFKNLLKATYRGSGYCSESKVCCQIGDKTRKLMGYITPQECLTTTISFDCISGIVETYNLSELRVPSELQTPPDSLTLEELLSYLEKEKRDDLEYSEVKKSVYLHQMDSELRKKVLELVPLKLVYSKHANPSIGYVRALQMIRDFNQYIPGLELDFSKIDEIMNQDYSKKQPLYSQKVIKQ